MKSTNRPKVRMYVTEDGITRPRMLHPWDGTDEDAILNVRVGGIVLVKALGEARQIILVDRVNLTVGLRGESGRRPLADIAWPPGEEVERAYYAALKGRA